MEFASSRTQLPVAAPSTTSPAAQRVVSHICELFEAGQLRPGDRLPSERALAQTIGVSRPSLRAGLQSLAAVGLVASRRGSGTYVSARLPSMRTAPLRMTGCCEGASWKDLFEARTVLEIEVVTMAAQRATATQLRLVGDVVERLLMATGDPLEFLRFDLQFHETVARASGNPVLGTLVASLRAWFAEFQRSTVLGAHDLALAARLHLEIYRALRSHDPRLARDAMAAHLEHARREYVRAQHSAVHGAPLENH
jgi:GntR family transcriptional repressor for pyruvate dehydrogenase complex